jgi:AcrR family transcriptional regulator
MAKIKQSPKLPAETRREQLLAAAYRLFADRGYRETSIDDIARLAGLTKGAVYFHFRSKEEMLEAMMESLSARFRAVLEAHLPEQTRPQDFLRVLLVKCPWVQMREFRSTMDIWVQAIRVPRIRRQMNLEHRRMVDMFCRRLVPGHGFTRKELDQLGLMVISMADGLAAHRVLMPKSIDINMQLALFERMVTGIGFGSPVRKKAVRRKSKQARTV